MERGSELYKSLKKYDGETIEQQWPLLLAVDATLPKPWFVVGYSTRVVRSVLRVDYGGRERSNNWVEVAGGEMRIVYHQKEMYGVRAGTLFVLWDERGYSRLIDECLAVAENRGFRVETLKDGRHDR